MLDTLWWYIDSVVINRHFHVRVRPFDSQIGRIKFQRKPFGDAVDLLRQLAEELVSSVFGTSSKESLYHSHEVI